MEKLKELPEKWCIRQNASQISCDWFNEKFNTYTHTEGNFEYLVNYDAPSDSCYENVIPEGFEEITFEQFKVLVLKDLQFTLPLEDQKPEDMSYLIKFIKNLNIG